MWSVRPHQGWVVIGVVFLGMAVAIGGTHYSFGVFVEPLEREFGWSRTEVTASLSFSAVSALMAPFIGRALDRFGARPVMTISILTLALTFGLRPLMGNVGHWYLISFVHFVAFPGASMLAGPKLVGNWFPRTRGRMMGVASMGANFGGIFLPPSLGALIMATTWRWGFITLGAMAGLVGMLALLFVRDRKGGESTSQGEESKPQGPMLAFDMGATVKEALRSQQFYAMTFGIIAANFAYSAVLSQIVPHLEAEGLTQQRATLFLSLMAIFGMAGKVSFGYLTERIGFPESAGVEPVHTVHMPGGADYAAGLAGAVRICADTGVGVRGNGVGDAPLGAGHGGDEKLRDDIWSRDAGYGILIAARAPADGVGVRPARQLCHRVHGSDSDICDGDSYYAGGEAHAPGRKQIGEECQ